MLDQQVEQGMDVTIANEMIVIQDQDEIIRHIGQIINEQRNDMIDCGETWCFEQAGDAVKRFGKGTLQGSGERPYKDAPLVIVLVEGKPGYRSVDRLYPLCQQGRLAKTCRGTYQRDIANQPCIQALKETDTGDDVRTGTWSIEFCANQWTEMAGTNCDFRYRRQGSDSVRLGHAGRLACECLCRCLEP